MAENVRIATVSQVTNYIKRVFEANKVLGDIWVTGEISNLKIHTSGHIYMTLKDDGAVIRAVMFKGAARGLAFKPENGGLVQARGRIAVFEREGQYQLYIEEMKPDGQGDLHVQFELLKKKLQEEGLFDAKHKKPIPTFPTAVGIITSETGAAVRDMLNVLSRRYKVCDVLLYPVLVQGEGASEQIKCAIERFNQRKDVDCIICGRGGGSIEDLWAFNEEVTARAIFSSAIPIISAVGHETDFTIADFVADLRAPTPSAAAELAVPDTQELQNKIANLHGRLSVGLRRKVEVKRQKLEGFARSFSYQRFKLYIDGFRQKNEHMNVLLENSINTHISSKREKLGLMGTKLQALSPLAALGRGYSMVMGKNGKIVVNTADVAVGEQVTIRLSKGALGCVVKNKE